jgi:hypothetical protein
MVLKFLQLVILIWSVYSGLLDALYPATSMSDDFYLCRHDPTRA